MNNFAPFNMEGHNNHNHDQNHASTEHHEEALPNFDVQEETPVAQVSVPEGGFKDEGFLNAESVGYDRHKMDLIGVEEAAQMLGVSPGTARKIIKDPHEAGLAKEGEVLDYQEIGRRIEVPRVSVSTLVVRSFRRKSNRA